MYYNFVTQILPFMKFHATSQCKDKKSKPVPWCHSKCFVNTTSSQLDMATYTCFRNDLEETQYYSEGGKKPILLLSHINLSFFKVAGSLFSWGSLKRIGCFNEKQRIRAFLQEPKQMISSKMFSKSTYSRELELGTVLYISCKFCRGKKT